MTYKPNKKWLWQTFAFMVALPTFALTLTPRSDPMFFALLLSIAIVVVIFGVRCTIELPAGCIL